MKTILPHSTMADLRSNGRLAPLTRKRTAVRPLIPSWKMTLVVSAAAWLTSANGRADNWPQFRGPGMDGLAPGASPPVEWSATNNLAWILATSPNPVLRDPEQAVRLLEAVRREEETLPELLDTLAAAYAAAGRFEDAVRSADQALALAHHQRELAAAIRERQTLYRSGRPYVEPPRYEAGGDAS